VLLNHAALERGATASLVALTLLSACNAAPGNGTADVTGDAATRLVGEVRDGAARLTRSPSDTLVLSVASRGPGGCPDGYRVEWRADSDRIPGLGIVCTTGTRGYATIAYRQIVKVPRPLQVTKKNGEPVTIALHKRTDGAIEVTALQ
jgi:hypothetical protein